MSSSHSQLHSDATDPITRWREFVRNSDSKYTEDDLRNVLGMNIACYTLRKSISSLLKLDDLLPETVMSVGTGEESLSWASNFVENFNTLGTDRITHYQSLAKTLRDISQTTTSTLGTDGPAPVWDLYFPVTEQRLVFQCWVGVGPSWRLVG
ncbi:hypothetical protein BCR39DRAFT_503041 [Naematelia encephala]|uniref:Uncharacterized protein n=1 Tax=Naematelia encephala TaxID=71784 RepID=A0A1Y2BM84_9TREE|nr:hypothetical protein BCR39DRAFT_503041 [Naematelia encephala]